MVTSDVSFSANTGVSVPVLEAALALLLPALEPVLGIGIIKA